MFEVQVMERGAELGTWDMDVMPTVGYVFEEFEMVIVSVEFVEDGGYYIACVKYI